jgi:hypothetical protein
MEGELFAQVYAWVECVVPVGPGGCHFSDRRIVLTYLWAVLHDRPVRWVCEEDQSLRETTGWADCPSRSTMSRRLPTASVQQALQVLERALAACWPEKSLKFIDAKPLPVGGCSKDPDARYGRAAGCFAKGYKFHAIKDVGGPVRAWQLEPMNVAGQPVARQLLPQVAGPGQLVGDADYDVSYLYDQAAGQQLQLICRPPKRGAGQGGHYQSPHRLASLALAATPSGQRLLELRIDIEQYFGQLGNCGGGLSPLPNWVRRLKRVRLWVQAKVILHLVRCAWHQGLAA